MAINIGDYFSLGNTSIGNSPAYQSSTGGPLYILSVALKNIYTLASVILLLFIFAGGLGMIINAGNAEKQKKSSQTLSSAVIGFLILITSYWVILILETILGVNIVADFL